MARRQRMIVLEERDGTWQAPAADDFPRRHLVVAVARAAAGWALILSVNYLDEGASASRLLLAIAGLVALGWFEAPWARALVLVLALAGPARDLRREDDRRSARADG